jgi:hypothetical protein
MREVASDRAFPGPAHVAHGNQTVLPEVEKQVISNGTND